MFRKFIISVCGPILLAGLLHADASRSLTIEECLKLGLENNPGLKSSQAGVSLAQARVREAYASALPSVKLTGGYTRLSYVDPFIITLPLPGRAPISETVSPSIPNNYAAKLTVQQPIFTGFRLASATKAAREYLQATDEDFAASRARLAFDIRSSYWSLYKAERLQQLVTRSQVQVQAHLDDVRNLLAQGLAVRNDVLKTEVQLANVGLLKLDAENAVRLARTALNNQIGLSLDTETEPSSEADTIASAPEAGLDSLIAEAQRNRPEVRATEHRVRLAAAAVTVAEGAWYPQIAFTGNYYYSRPNQRYQPPQDKFNKSWDLGLGASFDVWNWGMAAHQTAEARAQLIQVKAGLEIARDGVALEATQDYQNLLSAIEKARATGQALGQAEENQQAVEASFKAGSATSSDVLDAETLLLQAQVNRTASQVDMELARAKLQKTLGQE